MIMGLECLSYEEWLRAGGEKPKGDLINVSKYLRLGRVKKMERDSVPFSEGTIGNRHKVIHRILFLNKRKRLGFFTTVAIREMPGDIVGSSSMEIFKMQVEPTQGNLL